VGDFSSSQFYRFHSTRREDAGSYQCIARNDAGSIFSEKSDVVVACKFILHRNGGGWGGILNPVGHIFTSPYVNYGTSSTEVKNWGKGKLEVRKFEIIPNDFVVYLVG